MCDKWYVVYKNDRTCIEPLKPLRSDDSSVTWLLGWVATNYDDVEFERTDGRIKRIVIKWRLEGEEFERLVGKASWAIKKAAVRSSRRPYRRTFRRWKRGQ